MKREAKKGKNMPDNYGCAKASSSMESVGDSYWGMIKTYQSQYDFHRYAPPANTASDLISGDSEWDEIEKMGPSAGDLIKLAQHLHAPDGWD